VTKRIFASIMAVSFIAMILSFMFITAVTQSISIARSQEGLATQAEVIASGIKMNGGRFLNETDFGDYLRVTWVSRSGKVIYDSDKDVRSLGDHSDRAEIKAAQKNGSGSASRYSATTKGTAFYYAIRLDDGTVLRVSGGHTTYSAQVVSLLRPTIIVIILLILLSALFAVVSSKLIVKPINSIDLNDPKKGKRYRELEPLLVKLHGQNVRVSRQIDELRRSREQFDQVTEHMTEGIVAANSRSMILTCNSAAAELLGAGQISEGQSIFALNRSDTFRRCVNDAMGGKRSECVIHTDGGDREIIASPAKSSDRINGVVVFIMDVTEKQQLEVMRREFTSNVSHELKTPLTTIYGSADMLANGIVKPEDVQQFGGNIRSEADRLITLIDDIVSLSKLDEDAVPRETEDIDLYDLSDEVVRRLAPAAAEKNVTGDITGSHVVFNGCRTVISEVIYNLCDNAIKYNNDGGSYTVKISQKHSKAVITVSDTGMGIPQQHIGRIFERFYRVDKSRSRRIKGTGLGLSIVKHGVMYHGGEVRAESKPGCGTTFIVELPLHKNTDAPAEE
jgi:two-component system phosphate regulon sensor histidine kinase PhoR